MFAAGLLFSCGGSKATSGSDLDSSITNASIKLKKNPNNERQVGILEDAYKKATDRDLASIEYLKQQVNSDPSKWLDIYNIYDKMQIREIAVVPLLPLYVDGREAQFDIPNIDVEANEAKKKASNNLYNTATTLLNSGDKMKAREAYDLYDRLIEFDYDYLDALDKRAEAKIKGSTNVYVQMKNSTGGQLPSNFESDLLSIRQGVFTDPWVLYHTQRQSGINYDYDVLLDVTRLIVGQDQQQQRQYRDQQQVIVGYRDVKDNEGNTVRQPQYGTVYADVLETTQAKPIRIEGSAQYTDNRKNEVVATIPLEREEAWQNVYAQFRGDERALSQESIAKIQAGQQPFPTDDQLLDFGGKLLNQVVINLFEQNNSNLN